ncbi:MAG TPA: glycosyl transferase [Fibrobacteres bacterium]|nr:glycosyl transferase [Fibrobacterota bacterium]
MSIITVCYNSVSTIEDTLLSVANQKHTNKEHIVIDGASTDATMETVRRYSSILRSISEPDRGVYDAMNKGIAMATGEIVGTLNADDVYADDSVLAQVAEIFTDPNVDACYADLVYVDQYDSAKIVRYWKSRDYREGLFECGWMPAHPTFFVRRSVYERFGDFDLSFHRQSDFELTLRFLAIHKIKSVYIPKIWVKMRMGGVSNNSISGIIEGNIEAYKACRKNNLDVYMLPFIARKLFSRLPQFFKKPGE